MAEKKVEEFNLDENVTVKSMSVDPTGFARITGYGDVQITPNGMVRLSRNEILSQVQNGVKEFVGIDGLGNHAVYYIDDKATRVYLGFETEDGKTKQNILTDSKLKELFEIKTMPSFKKKIGEEIVTRTEKNAVLKMVERLKLNDYAKIKYLEEYTGRQMP